MISERFRVVLLIVMALYFLGLIYSLSRKYILMKHTLVWIFSGLLMTLLIIFPGILSRMADAFGVYSDTNLLFGIAIGFMLLIIIYLTHVVTKLTESNRHMIQEIALLNKKIDDINAGVDAE